MRVCALAHLTNYTYLPVCNETTRRPKLKCMYSSAYIETRANTVGFRSGPVSASAKWHPP